MTSYTDAQIEKAPVRMVASVEKLRQLEIDGEWFGDLVASMLRQICNERNILQSKVDAFHRLLPIWREREMQAYNKHGEYYDGKSHGIEICADHLEEVIASNTIEADRDKKGGV